MQKNEKFILLKLKMIRLNKIGKIRNNRGGLAHRVCDGRLGSIPVSPCKT